MKTLKTTTDCGYNVAESYEISASSVGSIINYLSNIRCASKLLQDIYHDCCQDIAPIEEAMFGSLMQIEKSIDGIHSLLRAEK